MSIFNWRNWFKPRPIDPLDVPLMHWSPNDPLSIRDLLNGGILCCGRSGSAKTSGFGRTTLQAIVKNRRSAGLLLAAKQEDIDDYREIFARAGRPDDLLVVHPDGELRCNFIDYVRKMGGDTRDITKCITTIAETLRQADTKGGGEERDYWEQQQERMIYNAVECVKLGQGAVTAPDLQAFIATAATEPAQLLSETWKARFHNQLMAKAFHAKKDRIEEYDWHLANEYWLTEFPNLANRTRSSIQAGVMQTFHVFNTGIVRQMVSGDTNVSPDDILAGRWVLVNMPASKYGDSGQFVSAGWKYLTQKAVLHRKAKASDPFVTIWVDEAQQHATSHDSHYMAQCRSHLGCQVFLTQSTHSLFAAMGKSGEQAARALLANFTTQIFHALGSQQDADYASGLIGKSLQSFMGGSHAPQESWFDALLGLSRYTASWSEHYEHIVQPNVFLHGLRCGGPENGFLADAIVIKNGENFSDGRCWKRVVFNQKG